MRHLFWLLSLLVTSQAFAWGFNGHKAICEAAYDLSSTHTQQRLDAIVKKQGGYHSFAESCTWADDIKKDHQWDWSKHLHYVNLPRSAKVLKASDCGPKGCVLSAIKHYRAVLTQNPNDWQALFFLSHFVGDIHQPLHVSYADDWGGNKTKGMFFGKEMNLHGIWDYGMLDHMGGDDWLHFGDQLAKLASPSMQGGTPLQWGNESYQITRQVYRYYGQHHDMGQEYVDHFGPIAKVRMEKAAERLAAILDKIYQQH